MESYLHTTIAQTTLDLDIDIRFLNSHIFTTNDISGVYNLSETKGEIKYLCICSEIILDECIVVADVKVKPQFLLIVSILTFLTKVAINPRHFTITSTTTTKIQGVKSKKFIFNNNNLISKFENISKILDSNSESKKELFYMILEWYRKTKYSDKDIASWGSTDLV